MATKDRVYVVEVKHPEGEAASKRLVRATVGHIAERHVIGHLVAARVASKDDLIELLTAGIRLEDASDEDPAQIQLPAMQAAD